MKDRGGSIDWNK